MKKEKEGMKNLKRIIVICLILLSVFTVSKETRATNTVSSNEGTQIKYKTVKVKEHICILKGQKRVLFPRLEYGTIVESNNQKVLQVANSGLAYGRKLGTAKVTVTYGNIKTIYTVEVKDAVDLILFAGQSNMYGTGGNYNLAPSVPTGVAYEYDIYTKSKDLLEMKEPFGRGTMKQTWSMSGMGYSNQGTIASAFCINYYKQTKTPVVGVFAAGGGISSQTWLEGKYMRESLTRLKDAKKYLKKKKIKVRHIYVVWYQGETDAMNGVEPDAYIKNMKAIQKKYKSAGAEQMMVIRIGNNKNDENQMKAIAATQVKLCQSDKNFTLVSKIAASFSSNRKNYYADILHINQYGLNKIGYEAGKNAGKYAKKHKKKNS